MNKYMASRRVHWEPFYVIGNCDSVVHVRENFAEILLRVSLPSDTFYLAQVSSTKCLRRLETKVPNSIATKETPGNAHTVDIANPNIIYSSFQPFGIATRHCPVA